MSRRYLYAITPRAYPLRYVSPAVCPALEIGIEVSEDTGTTVESYLPIYDLARPSAPRWLVTTPRFLTVGWTEYPQSLGYQVAVEIGDQYYVLDDFVFDTQYTLSDDAWEWWLSEGHTEDEAPPVVYRAYTYYGLTEYSEPAEMS